MDAMGGGRAGNGAPAVRHRPQHGANTIADRIQQSIDSLQLSDAKQEPPKRRRRRRAEKAGGDAACVVESARDGCWVIRIGGLAKPEELEDDDEYDDVVADLTADVERFGELVGIHLNRTTGDLAVSYSNEAHAHAVVAAKQGQLYGGRQLAVNLHHEVFVSSALEPIESPGETHASGVKGTPEPIQKKARKRRSKIKNAVIKAQDQRRHLPPSTPESVAFTVKNMVEAAEVRDNDEYAAVVGEVAEALAQYGAPPSVAVVRNPDEGDLGDVVVTFQSAGDARSAFDALNGSKYGGRTLQCTWLQRGNAVVVVDGMVDPEELEDDDEFADVCDEVEGFLAGLCGPAGRMGDVSISRSTGQVSVVFATAENAREAIDRINEKAYGGRKLEAHDVLPRTPVAITENHEHPPTAATQKYAQPSEAVIVLLTAFLRRLASLQERAHVQNPLQDKRSRRLVLGLHEVRRGLQTHRIKLLLLALDLDECDELDGKLAEVVDIATREDIPIIRALTRRKLGRILKKHARVSCVGVYSIDGANDIFRELLLEHHRQAREASRGQH